MPQPNKEAQDEFEAAIQKYLEAQGYAESGFLVDWMLVTAEHVPLEDGQSMTSMVLHVSANQPLYRTSGLARYASNLTDKRM